MIVKFTLSYVGLFKVYICSNESFKKKYKTDNEVEVMKLMRAEKNNF